MPLFPAVFKNLGTILTEPLKPSSGECDRKSTVTDHQHSGKVLPQNFGEKIDNPNLGGSFSRCMDMVGRWCFICAETELKRSFKEADASTNCECPDSVWRSEEKFHRRRLCGEIEADGCAKYFGVEDGLFPSSKDLFSFMDFQRRSRVDRLHRLRKEYGLDKLKTYRYSESELIDLGSESLETTYQKGFGPMLRKPTCTISGNVSTEESSG
ncbi:hypothetical protein BJ508DRAFT_138762 [Ascobolus immersus RN42]|uniref:Uncharacterized protein n=1 Tax=Ascobolus immersus RN42 TaxID=1160509 RepID=A0A3N4I0K0_ASCIM|nr:hypothetical protein BJ508DRAFT_138762 [Ascobolus immersus RN42]